MGDNATGVSLPSRGHARILALVASSHSFVSVLGVDPAHTFAFTSIVSVLAPNLTHVAIASKSPLYTRDDVDDAPPNARATLTT